MDTERATTVADQIEVYADIWCPFAYVGLQRLAIHRDRVHSSTRLRVRPWPLELINGTPMEAEAVDHKVADLRAQVAPDLFVGFDASTPSALLQRNTCARPVRSLRAGMGAH